MSSATPTPTAAAPEQQQQPSGSSQNDATAATAAAADVAASPSADTPLGPDGQPLTKSAMKKLAKLKEKEAKQAAKDALKSDKPAQNAAGSGAAKKEKPKKEVKQEPEWVNNTVPGEKKDLSGPMESGYNPLHVEQSWYQWWEKSNHFKPAEPTESDPYDPEKTFIIPAPPPNVTGSLHIGHALTISIQDTLIRWYRMNGYRTLFNPGYDHAGIATQSVVEKRLAKTEGKSRHDYGREKFLEKVFAWKDDYQSRISNQMRRLGASYDFSREAFTMDPVRSKAVTEAFCKLHEDGIIYRANRLVNWCCKLSTALSNIEVDQKQLNGRTLMNVPGYPANERIEFGVIFSFSYQIEGSDEKIVVATTRPETMLGDTAVAVHPDDSRYKHLHGKNVIHPFVPGRKVPIVADSIIVDMEFGTGAVKITPAHDPNDYEVGKRHDLEFINILNEDGTLNENCGEFAGMKRFSARRAVVDKLKEIGSYIETKDNPMTVPICSRSGDIIEPLMKPQWWVNCKPLADKVIERVRAGDMTITPAVSEKEFFRWMENIQDWCISRQLWWGHRCPVYFVNIEGELQDRSDDKYWISGRTLQQAQERAAKLAGGKKFTLEQDDDVLDTWFSSGLWPFSIMGWPEKTDDFKHFYPSSMLETGWDILFFWVAKMCMLGVYLTGTLPFKEVFCHAMVRDAHGRKMSKSLGNVIDPLDVIEGISLDGLHGRLQEGNLDDKEIAKAAQGQKKDFPKGIPQCGTDALRFALCAYTSAGRDINLDILRVEGYRKFCNKLWNATKFALLKLEPIASFQPASSDERSGNESLVEKWILHKLNAAAKTVNENLKERNFMAATSAVYNFWLYELCDVYIEAIKPITDAGAADAQARASAQQTLYTCLDAGLKLLHPFMPFVTEELWQRLPRRSGEKADSIALATYPVYMAGRDDMPAEVAFEEVFAAVRAIRGMCTDYNLLKDVQVFLETADSDFSSTLNESSAVVATLVKGCTRVSVVSSAADVPKGCAVSSISSRLNAHVLIRGLVNIDQELAKLDKKLTLNQVGLDKVGAAMNKPQEWERMPEDVKESTKEKLKALQAERSAMEAAKRQFESIRDD
ncbi:putative valine--tRNA ligase [Mycosarcoma maydis]|uniref:Valine--tRNA ligase, mitochondrial n=1 Tax=Mycosarcoma maydis TaxID=5270 RepID=A0A0D1CP62_MYCMD|nr:putative valine--tRNA ligase [Ustilago maydis 521]KIS68423.1 putative valine--tRNA ligase [Ustilago maydis 521]|eukprot:XP_011390102.1 putative valine--tRNA ligase [Ustilago maydis 521]